MSSPIQGTPSRRFYELDSLRGVAALTVVLSHFCYLLPAGLASVVFYSPLHLIAAGHQAVILFFLLSGFVLTLPYMRRSGLDYGPFLLKRVCRIYLPYLAALALAVVCDHMLPAYASNNFWINETWSQPVSSSLVLRHILFLGDYNWAQFNTAFWSLVYEMRISLIFPFIALAVLRLRARWSLLAAPATSLLAIGAIRFLLPKLAVDKLAFTNSLLTLHYIAFFILGSLLAANLPRIHGWYSRFSSTQVALLFVVALLFYGCSDMVVLGHMPFPLYDWFTALGAIVLILMSLKADPLQRFLNHPTIHHLGAVSYSLYLVHGTVLFALIHTCLGRIPLYAIFVIYLAVTLLLTEVFYRCIERPTMLLGRRLTARKASAVSSKM
jgi:peptidoglycan/LPS O-acetylase OafA/YrhL